MKKLLRSQMKKIMGGDETVATIGDDFGCAAKEARCKDQGTASETCCVNLTCTEKGPEQGSICK